MSDEHKAMTPEEQRREEIASADHKWSMEQKAAQRVVEKDAAEKKRKETAREEEEKARKDREEKEINLDKQVYPLSLSLSLISTCFSDVR